MKPFHTELGECTSNCRRVGCPEEAVHIQISVTDEDVITPVLIKNMNDDIVTMEQEERMNDIMAKHREEAEFDEEVEPSEVEIALKGLDKEHADDYMAIYRAVSRTDLSERLVDLAVKTGLHERNV